MASCQELADGSAESALLKARPAAVVRTPPQSAERRAGPRHGPVISGDPEIDLTARQVTGCGGFRTSARRRSAPVDFFPGADTDEGASGALLEPGGGALAV